MNEDLKRVGILLKAKRRDLNLTLKEVENSTSIRAAYIEAIEEASIHQNVSAVYAIGFMKQYANFMGMDVESMAREAPLAFKMPQEKHEFDYGIGTLEMRGSIGGGVKWLPSLFWAFMAGSILVAAWYVAKYLGVL